MEPLFINQYARDEAVIKEIYRSYYLTPISIMFYFCAGISFIANLIFLLLNHAIYDTCAFFATIVCLLSPPLFYRCRFSIAIKQDKDRFGQPPLMTYEISGSGIRSGTNGHFSQELPFSEIRYARESTNLIMLPSRSRLGYVIRKEGFIKGSFPEFYRFLHEKKIRFK